ncbi:MAG: sensor histidine kinase, partial [Rhodospirillales bacterium]
EEREKVFERFWRGARNDRPGSGLGLAICFEVAAAHGWRIWCTQGASGGARFEVAFAPKQHSSAPSHPMESERT